VCVCLAFAHSVVLRLFARVLFDFPLRRARRPAPLAARMPLSPLGLALGGKAFSWIAANRVDLNCQPAAFHL
jgi:hypothetical protein